MFIIVIIDLGNDISFMNDLALQPLKKSMILCARGNKSGREIGPKSFPIKKKIGSFVTMSKFILPSQNFTFLSFLCQKH